MSLLRDHSKVHLYAEKKTFQELEQRTVITILELIIENLSKHYKSPVSSDRNESTTNQNVKNCQLTNETILALRHGLQYILSWIKKKRRAQ